MHTYRVAQRLLIIDPSLPEMASLRVDRPPSLRREGRLPGDQSLPEDVFRGEGQLGTTRRHIECRWSPRGYSLRVDGVGHFRVTGDGRRISRSDRLPPGAPPPEQLTETVLGPAMTLALALQGVWCLHASAVECGGKVIAFLGRSGAGKSTLARELPRIDAAGAAPALRCAADDVLPVTLDDPDDDTISALPRFPQLKYRLDRQPGDALPARLPLRRIYVVEPTEDPRATASSAPLSGAAAVLALVRHTVAARLFTKDLLARQMEFAARVAERVEIFRLSYPHRPDVLRPVRRLLLSGPRPSDPTSRDLPTTAISSTAISSTAISSPAIAPTVLPTGRPAR